MTCFFEDLPLADKERMLQWLDRKTEGDLIFDDRPFVKYHVRPTKRIELRSYVHSGNVRGNDLYSGTFTIVFTAYDPLGEMMYRFYDGVDQDGAGNYCGILDKSEMPAAPSAESRDFIMYNCGTEQANTIIRIAGTAPNGLTIRNRTNGQTCVIRALPPETGYLELDSRMGRVDMINHGVRTLAYEYHDRGYITLEPFGRMWDNVLVEYEAGNNEITIRNIVPTQELVGQYVYLSGEWIRIIAVLATGHVVITKRMENDGLENTHLARMNEIEITGDNVELTKLEVDYTPRIL